jgi:ABC-type multidrug transport system ATPase subunit
MAPVTALGCEDLVCAFGSQTVLEGVDLSVGSGEWLGVVGANGCGKTVLLNAISGIARPRSGRVALHGVDVTRWSLSARARRGGLIRTFEANDVATQLSPRQHLVFAAGREQGAACEAWLERTNLVGQADVPCGDLSLGQRRRLGLAIVAMRSRQLGERAVVLMDEPFRGLDSEARHGIAAGLRDSIDPRAAVVLVEHDWALARRLADRLQQVRGGRLAVPDADRDRWSLPAPVKPRGPRVTVAVTELHAGYGGVGVLKGLNLVCTAGSIVRLNGRNGCGKSTLLRVLTGGIVPGAGVVEIGGCAVIPGEDPQRYGIGYVRQGGRLVPTLSVQAHLDLTARVESRTERAFLDAVPEARSLSGVVGGLSAGQRALLSIRLALRREPAVLLADEPTAALLPELRSRVYEFLAGTWVGESRTLIFVEHGDVPAPCEEVYIEDGRARAI